MKFSKEIIDKYLYSKLDAFVEEQDSNDKFNYVYITRTYLMPNKAVKLSYATSSNISIFMYYLENNLVENAVIEDIQEFMIANL
jgi:hypothetical protein